MFKNIKMQNLEEKVAEQDKEIRSMKDEIASLKQAVIVGTGQLEGKLMWNGPFAVRQDLEKTAPVNKVLRAIVDQLGLQIVATAEKTETTPERVTVQPIDKAGSDKRD